MRRGDLRGVGGLIEIRDSDLEAGLRCLALTPGPCAVDAIAPGGQAEIIADEDLAR